MAAVAPKTPFRRRTQARSLEVYEETRIDAIECGKCHSGDSADELILCDGCDLGFHIFCLRPILACVPYGSWFCPSCSSSKNPKPFPLIQTKIVDFFRIQRSPSGFEKPESRKRKKRHGGLVVAKKKRKLLPYAPSENPERRMEQMASLATALTTTGAIFSDNLTYCPGMAPRTANRAELEHGGVQVLSKEDAEVLNLCKRMMERGECPPLLVVFDPCEGFTVEADRFIKDLTIITEYVGDVDFLEKREHYDGDSVMTSLSAKNPSRSLVICPDKHSNIARFISGINNYTQDGKKKQNLKCVRFDVDGECRVLLVANRDISKGFGRTATSKQHRVFLFGAWIAKPKEDLLPGCSQSWGVRKRASLSIAAAPS